MQGKFQRFEKAISATFGVVALIMVAEQAAANELANSETVFGTDVVSAGVGGLRGEADAGIGGITVSGVTGTVTKAILYWNGPTNVADPTVADTVFFDGNKITGINIGTSHNNCWGFEVSYSYVGDVTDFVGGDDVYEFDGSALLSADVELNGASLVVFFDDGNPANDRDVVVFHGNDSNISNPFDADGWNISLAGINYAAGTAAMEFHVSDGQSFLDDELVLNASTLVAAGGIFDGNTVPGSEIASDGATTGNLWDIRSEDVTAFLSPGPNDLTLETGVFSDCISAVAVLFDLPAGSVPRLNKEITSGPCVDDSDPEAVCEVTPDPVVYVAGADLVAAEAGMDEPTLPVNGVWTYGTSNIANAGAAFVQFPGSWHSDALPGGGCSAEFEGWQENPDVGDDLVPLVAVNPSGFAEPAVCAGIGTFDADTFWVHPNIDGSPLEYVVVRWTAPVDGTVDIAADWVAKHTGFVSTHVRLNGGALGPDDNTSGGDVNYALNGVLVTAGDTIDLVTGNGDDNYFADSTQFDATVTLYPAAEDIAVVVKAPSDHSIHYDFKITALTGGVDDPVVYDTVPAEWDVDKIDGDDVGFGHNEDKVNENSPGLACGEEDTVGTVDLSRGGKPGNKCQSSTHMVWTPESDGMDMVRVDLQSRGKNRPKQYYSPTSCGTLLLNAGAQLFDGETGELLDETPELCVAAVDDPDYEPDGTGDVDGDGATDYEEACTNDERTDPCEFDDIDGDGVFEGDLCPLEGVGTNDDGLIVGTDGCLRLTQCNDTVDNDLDFLIDFAGGDASCTDIDDDSENTEDDTDTDGIANDVDSCPALFDDGVDADADGVDSVCDDDDGNDQIGDDDLNGQLP